MDAHSCMVVWALWSVVSSFTPPLSSGSATQHSGSRKACSVHGVEKCSVSTYLAFLIAPSASPRETCL